MVIELIRRRRRVVDHVRKWISRRIVGIRHRVARQTLRWRKIRINWKVVIS